MKKTYILGSIKYGFATGTGKWDFIGEKYQLRIPVKGGRSVADHIAKLVNAGLVRTKGVGLDNIARNAIEKKLTSSVN
jgi:hypothetical protein